MSLGRDLGTWMLPSGHWGGIGGVWGGDTGDGTGEGFPEGARGSYKGPVHCARGGLSAALALPRCLSLGAPAQKFHQLSNIKTFFPLTFRYCVFLQSPGKTVINLFMDQANKM